MKLFISNISFKSSEKDLSSLFSKYGEVSSCKIILDKATQKSKGFGFIEMPDDSDAKRAIKELDQYELGGRKLNVKEAEDRVRA